MALSDEDKQQLTDMVLRALDVVDRDYEDTNVKLTGAVLLWEVEMVDESDEDQASHQYNWHTLIGQAAMHSVGMAQGMIHVIMSSFYDTDN